MNLTEAQFLKIAGAGLSSGLVVGLIRSAFTRAIKSLFAATRSVLR